jgi:hypothetical protein
MDYEDFLAMGVKNPKIFFTSGEGEGENNQELLEHIL